MATAKKKNIDDMEDENVYRMLTGKPPIKKKTTAAAKKPVASKKKTAK